MRRPKPLPELSARVVDYLVDEKGLAQNRVAEILDVDKSFVSRVRGGERELSTTHLTRLAETLQIPLGVLLLEATRPAKRVPDDQKELFDLCETLMRQADDALAKLRTRPASS